MNMRVFAAMDLEKKGSYFVWSPSSFLVEEYIRQSGWGMIKTTKKRLEKYLKKNLDISYDLEELELTGCEAFVLPKFQVNDYEDIKRIEKYRINAALDALDFLLEEDGLSEKEERSIRDTIQILKEKEKKMKYDGIDHQSLHEIHENRERFRDIISTEMR